MNENKQCSSCLKYEYCVLNHNKEYCYEYENGGINMNEKEFNVNEIVKVESLGVIKQQLDKVEIFIDEKIKDIPKTLEKIKKMSFEQQEENKKDIKKYRTYLNKLNGELEAKRKEIHNEIEKPYNEFNDYYSKGVKVKLQNGINQLDEAVNSIETQQKLEKENELREFAQQHIESNDLQNIITFEDVGLNITVTASIKSLKEQALEFINKTVNDLKLIEMEEYKDEIYVEYQKNLDFVKSKMLVVERHRQLEELKKQQENIQDKIQEEKKVVEKVEEVVAPKEIIEDDEIITVQFNVKGEKSKIVELKNKIIELGLEWY